MTDRYSKGLRNFVADEGSYKDAFEGGVLKIYSGSQPNSADDAPTGTLLVTISNASGAHTSETPATGTVTLTGGASGSVDSITVDGIELLSAAVAFDTNLDTTAANVADAINARRTYPNYKATVSGAIITLTAHRGVGTDANGLSVVSTTTTITATDVNLSGGVDSVNGLNFGIGAAGVITKNATQTWSGVTAVTGVAGWFRLEGPIADSGLVDTTESQLRIDGSVGTSGADLNLSSTSLSAGATQTISNFSITLPAN